jgi:hypothetical protein
MHSTPLILLKNLGFTSFQIRQIQILCHISFPFYLSYHTDYTFVKIPHPMVLANCLKACWVFFWWWITSCWLNILLNSLSILSHCLQNESHKQFSWKLVFRRSSWDQSPKIHCMRNHSGKVLDAVCRECFI